jgi:multiple sugar transport system ATP-binding protein
MPRIRVTPEVIEGLGAETNIIFPLDAPRVDSDTVRSAAERDEDDAGTLLADDDRAHFTARIATRKPVSANGPIELAVHHESLHYFDPQTGVAMR